MELQNVEGFTVRPRSSTIKYKDSELRSPEIGNDLNVNYLLKGFVQLPPKDIEIGRDPTNAGQFFCESLEKRSHMEKPLGSS